MVADLKVLFGNMCNLVVGYLLIDRLVVDDGLVILVLHHGVVVIVVVISVVSVAAITNNRWTHVST